MILQILTHAPIWVWPLLILLVALGLIATKARTRSAVPMYFFWLLGLLSVRSVYAMAPDISIWIVFALAYLAGGRLGYVFQRGIITAKTGQQITVKGEWLTLVVLMMLFWMNFIGGVMGAVAPEIVSGVLYQIVFTILAGLAAGSFIGRSLRTYLTPST